MKTNSQQKQQQQKPKIETETTANKTFQKCHVQRKPEKFARKSTATLGMEIVRRTP